MLIFFLISKIVFMKYLPPFSPETKSAQNLLKFGTFGISNMSLSILLSKRIFINYLPIVEPKLAPK